MCVPTQESPLQLIQYKNIDNYYYKHDLVCTEKPLRATINDSVIGKKSERRTKIHALYVLKAFVKLK